MTAPQPWSVVRKIVDEHIDRLKEDLTRVEAERVRDVQTEIRVYRQFIAWFESGAPKDKLLGDAPPEDNSTSPTPRILGGY